MNPGEHTDVDRLVVGPFQENTWLLRAKGRPETIVIDPGDEADRLCEAIDSAGLELVAIVNTHAHLDHVGAVAPLKARYAIPFYLHPDDFGVLERGPESAMAYGLPPFEVPSVDVELADGDRLDLAGLAIDVVFTPGHCPGHVSLHVDGRCFGGDCLFAGSIGRTDLPGGDTATLMATLRDHFLTLPDETIVHSGHGPDTTIGQERATNPFLQ